jgi:hypothetical protein
MRVAFRPAEGVTDRAAGQDVGINVVVVAGHARIEADLLDEDVPSFVYSRVAQGRYPEVP